MESDRAIVVINGERVEVPATVEGIATWREALAAFITQQDVRKSSRDLYSRTLKLFFEWAEKSGKALDALKLSDLLEYKDGLFAKGLSSLTIGGYINSLRRFYDWAESCRYYPNIAKSLRTPKRRQAFKKQHLNEEKSVELLEHFKESSLRDFAIVNLILRTGLRTVEVMRADVGDITFMGGRRILKVWGKGRDGKEDFVILTDKAYLPIRDYLNSRGRTKAGEPLFISGSHRNGGDRLTTRTISRLCKEGLRAIGLDGREYTAHSLRHTTAVAILKGGGQLSDAQAVLRHSSPATTQIYTESIKEELRLQNAAEAILDDMF